MYNTSHTPDRAPRRGALAYGSLAFFAFSLSFSCVSRLGGKMYDDMYR